MEMGKKESLSTFSTPRLVVDEDENICFSLSNKYVG